MSDATKNRILREARRMVRAEKMSDFLNDPCQYLRRVSVGYYHDRLAYLNRWLINDEQQQINEYYGRK